METKCLFICKFLVSSILVFCSLIYFSSCITQNQFDRSYKSKASDNLLMRFIVEIQWERDLSFNYLNSIRNASDRNQKQFELNNQREQTDLAFEDLCQDFKEKKDQHLNKCLLLVIQEMKQLKLYRSEMDAKALKAHEVNFLYGKISDQVIFHFACVN